MQAAQQASQLAGTIVKEHDSTVTRRVFWSDSLTVLHWIRRYPKEFREYVANRLERSEERLM